MGLYVQYGCGLSAPSGWVNFDASPTLRLQKIPVIGEYFKKKVNFSSTIQYGDIIKGLPGVANGSCDGVYCSHVLEHLSLNDLRKSLKNSYALLRPGGIFRCVVPDLEAAAREYLERKSAGDISASIKFMRETLLGIEERPRGVPQLASTFFGNSHHLWMWDADSLANELRVVGFKNVRRCFFNDSEDPNFKTVEDPGRFNGAVALEAQK